jgi:ABC-type nitrate/sulfonate/bicarbonate transport system substrate-binding protein
VTALRGLIAVFVALGLGQAAAAQDLVKVRVVFPSPPILPFLPHLVASERGWFNKAGLDVEETYIKGDPNAVRALVSGTVDLAYTGAFTAYSGIAEGAPLKVIASQQPVPDFRLIAQDKYKTLKELEGKRIAVSALGSMTQVMPELILKKHSVDSSKISFLAVGESATRLQAVLADRADAALVDTMAYVSQKPKGGINLIASVPEELPTVAFSYVIAKTSDIADPKMRRAFEIYLRWGVIEGCRYIMKNPDEAAKAFKARVPELDLALIQATLRSLNESNIWGINGVVSPASAEETIKLARQVNFLKHDLAYAEAVDSSMVDKSLAEAGRP